MVSLLPPLLRAALASKIVLPRGWQHLLQVAAVALVRVGARHHTMLLRVPLSMVRGRVRNAGLHTQALYKPRVRLETVPARLGRAEIGRLVTLLPPPLRATLASKAVLWRGWQPLLQVAAVARVRVWADHQSMLLGVADRFGIALMLQLRSR